MKVAIVKYNAGNVFSVANALERLGVEPVLTDDPLVLAAADKVVFPGVGEASSAMDRLRERSLDDAIKGLTQPVLAICLGMQLLCDRSDENDTECLGMLPYEVKRLPPASGKVPHMGWNALSDLKGPLFTGVEKGARAYFVHSYYVSVNKNTIATASYGDDLSAAIWYRNFYGVQFHPEKSGPVGARILENFLNL